MENPEPRANPVLLGHEAAEASLAEALRSGRMHHAWLITGPPGIGKATLAFRFARRLLAGVPEGDTLALDPAHPVFRRVAAGTHADLLTIEREWDEKRKRRRTEIIVEDVRAIANFLRLTPAEGGWRVVVVDGADEMNRNAANALLKILEEPPSRALLLLVAHSPGQLLPTIRSRCRRMALSPLAPLLVRQLLARYRPDLGEPEAEAIAALAGGSIGRALELAAAGGLELYRSLLGLLDRDGGIDPLALHAFADRLARAEAEEGYRAVEDLLGQLLVRLAIWSRRGPPDTGRGNAETSVLQSFCARTPAARWAELREEIRQSFA